MIRIKGFIIIVFLAVISLKSPAQYSQIMYFMRIPQNHLMNPAIRPNNRVYIGLPIISGVNTSINNNFLELTDIFTPNLKADSIISFQNPNFDLNRLSAKLKDNNNISVSTNLQVLGLGFTVGKDLYLYFDVMDRIEADAVFPRDLLNLYLKNYDQFLNQTVNLSGLNLKAQYFKEYGLGFSKKITEKLRIGAKVKLLSGIASMSFESRLLTFRINPVDYTKEFNIDATLGTSGRNRIEKTFKDNSTGGFIHDYFLAPVTNPGVAFDFGAVYNLNKMFSFSASVVDLGFINWKDDLQSYSPKSNTLIFPISTLQDVVDQTITLDSLFAGIKNTIDDNFQKDPTPAAYKTRLPTVINLGATINLLPVLSFGILSNSKIWAGQIKESLTLSANTYIGKFFSGSLSYTTANYSFDNFGIGIAFKAGPGQIYIIADKIPMSWSRIYLKKGNGDFTPLSLPDRWNTLNFQIGLNFAFGKVVDTKVDKPMLSGLIY